MVKLILSDTASYTNRKAVKTSNRSTQPLREKTFSRCFLCAGSFLHSIQKKHFPDVFLVQVLCFILYRKIFFRFFSSFYIGKYFQIFSLCRFFSSCYIGKHFQIFSLCRFLSSFVQIDTFQIFSWCRILSSLYRQRYIFVLPSCLTRSLGFLI